MPYDATSMSVISQYASAAIQPELVTGESILWTGQPDTSIVFHKDDLYLIPFSLLWGGFAIFWEGAVAFWGKNTWTFGAIWGISHLGTLLVRWLEKEAYLLRSDE